MASSKFWQWLTGLSAASLTGSEEVYVNDAGTSKKTTAAAINALAAGDYDAAGAAASAISTHEAAGDPHPGYALESALGGAALLDVGTTAGTVAAGDDSRLSDARTPTTHANSHASGGSDAVKIDDLSAADDNTDLDATTSAHGLLPKLGGGTTNFLRADGSWAEPPGTTGVSDGDKGDITVSGSGATWTIDAGTVSLAKMADLDPDLIIGRSTASTGTPETISCTAAGRSLIASATASAQRTALGLGSAATLDVGASANNVVQLDGSALLPAVDGSQLTGLPTGVLSHAGLTDLSADNHSQYHNNTRGDARYKKLPLVIAGSVSSGEITIDCANAGDVIVNLSLTEDVTAVYYQNLPTVCRVRWSITQSGGPYDIPQSAHPSGTVVESSYAIYQDDTVTRILWETMDGGTSSYLECNAPLDLSLIKLDDLATPDDNTDLNASTSAHGLLQKLNGVSTQYLDGTGAWTTPAGGGGGGTDSGLVITEASSIGGAMTCVFTENTSL